MRQHWKWAFELAAVNATVAVVAARLGARSASVALGLQVLLFVGTIGWVAIRFSEPWIRPVALVGAVAAAGTILLRIPLGIAWGLLNHAGVAVDLKHLVDSVPGVLTITAIWAAIGAGAAVIVGWVTRRFYPTRADLARPE